MTFKNMPTAELVLEICKVKDKSKGKKTLIQYRTLSYSTLHSLLKRDKQGLKEEKNLCNEIGFQVNIWHKITNTLSFYFE